MVYYRKYRPQTIDDLDSSTLREKLYLVLADPNLVAHAFLFTGPKGLGKTSTARIVAKVINCEVNLKLKTQNLKAQVRTQKLDSAIEPCNKCEQCVSIINGTNMDVIEIDAASNRGIDEIRDLKEKVKLSPFSASKKVYIIDEVHMLTTEAFNALLKTLEEPPEHVIFVLCTTEPQKIPATILSRCSHIMFQPATVEELVRSFERIVKGENLDIDSGVLKSIAELSDSGFRDGVKILEEMVLLSRGMRITQELIEAQYKTSSITYQIYEMLKALSTHNTKEAVAIVEKITSVGIDVKYFLTQLLNVLHFELLVSLGVEKSTRQDAILFRPFELQYLLEAFTKASSDMRYAVLPQIPLELAIVEWGMQIREDVQEGSQKLVDIVQDVSTPTEVEVTTQVVTMKTMRKNLGTMAKIKALYGEEVVKKDDEDEPQVVTNGVSLLHYDANTDTKEWMEAFWKSLISEMKTYNHTLAGLLRGCQLKSYDKKSLVIEALYKFHKDKLDEHKTMEALERVCKQLTGNAISVSVILKGK